MSLISYCGLDCSTCAAYIGTKSNDVALIERTAKEWTEAYHTPIAAKDVWCDGCTAQTSRHCGHWSECNIRICAQEHRAANCGACPEYGCEKISAFIELVPVVKPVLDKIHAEKS